jgi:hypothetical protein
MGPDAADVAEALMTRAREEMATSQCRDVATAIRIPELVQGLRLVAVKCGVAEEAVSFLVEVDQLRQAAEAISPAAAGALSKPRLRLVKASATNIAERFLAEQSRFNLPVARETSRAATQEIERAAGLADAPEPAPGLDHAMMEALVGPFHECEHALGPALALLRKKQSTLNQVVSQWKGEKGAAAGAAEGGSDNKGKNAAGSVKKHRVVILGGGMAGALAAFSFDNDPEDRFHVTLVDPKNFFEDVTAQPMVLADPGGASCLL